MRDEDRHGSPPSGRRARPNYLVSNVFRYHDTFPHPEVPHWPDLIPDADLTPVELHARLGTSSCCGDPDEALASCQRWESPASISSCSASVRRRVEDTLETIRLMGEHVIPKIDTDPVHRTTRMRDGAAAKV